MTGSLIVGNGNSVAVTLSIVTFTLSWVDNWGETQEAYTELENVTIPAQGSHEYKLEDVAKRIWKGSGLSPENRPKFFADTSEYYATFKANVYNGVSTKEASGSTSLNIVEL